MMEPIESNIVIVLLVLFPFLPLIAFIIFEVITTEKKLKQPESSRRYHMKANDNIG